MIENERWILGQWEGSVDDVWLQVLLWAKFTSALKFFKYHICFILKLNVAYPFFKNGRWLVGLAS